MTNHEDTNDQESFYRDPEWDQIISDQKSRTIEFDPMVSRLTREDREYLLKRLIDSGSYKAQTILAGVLLSFLLLFLLVMSSGFLISSDVIKENNFIFFAVFLFVVWVSLTIVIFRMFARRMNFYIRKLEYRKQVMFIETQRDVLVYSATAIIPVKEIHVWEYVSDRPEQVTYNVHNNTRLSKNIKDGDLIYRYSDAPDSKPLSLSFFVSQTK